MKYFTFKEILVIKMMLEWINANTTQANITDFEPLKNYRKDIISNNYPFFM